MTKDVVLPLGLLNCAHRTVLTKAIARGCFMCQNTPEFHREYTLKDVRNSVMSMHLKTITFALTYIICST